MKLPPKPTHEQMVLHPIDSPHLWTRVDSPPRWRRKEVGKFPFSRQNRSVKIQQRRQNIKCWSMMASRLKTHWMIRDERGRKFWAREHLSKEICSIDSALQAPSPAAFRISGFLCPLPVRCSSVENSPLCNTTAAWEFAWCPHLGIFADCACSLQRWCRVISTRLCYFCKSHIAFALRIWSKSNQRGHHGCTAVGGSIIPFTVNSNW